jgi:putative copper resistance protein D
LDALVVLSRFLQYVAVSLVGGGALFGLYAPRPPGLERLVRAGAVVGMLGAAAWLMGETANIGDGPLDALRLDKVWDIATGTGFGRAGLLRLCLFLAAAVTPARRGWLAAALGLLAAATFAWGGHAAAEDGVARAIHQGSDALHAVSAAIWLGALGALVLLAVAAASGGEASIGRLRDGMGAFSRIGLAVVAALFASGLANSWFTVGFARVPTLPASPYGRLLLAKLALFTVMLAFAAAHRYWHTARLGRGHRELRSTSRSLVGEATVGAILLAVVSWMGTLSPPTGQ